MEIAIFILLFCVSFLTILFLRQKVLLLPPQRKALQEQLSEHLLHRFGPRAKEVTFEEGPLVDGDEGIWLHASFVTSLPSTFCFTLTGRMTIGGLLSPKVGKNIAPCEVEFDSRFKILTSDGLPFKTLLNSPRGSALLIKLYEFGSSHDTSISLSDGRLTISTPYHPKTGGELEGFYRLAGAFATAVECAHDKRTELLSRDGWPLLVDENAQSLSPKEVSPKGKTVVSDICVSCGGTIDFDALLCTLCLGPHHRECWEREGRCATFGCGYEYNSLMD